MLVVAFHRSRAASRCLRLPGLQDLQHAAILGHAGMRNEVLNYLARRQRLPHAKRASPIGGPGRRGSRDCPVQSARGRAVPGLGHLVRAPACQREGAAAAHVSVKGVGRIIGHLGVTLHEGPYGFGAFQPLGVYLDHQVGNSLGGNRA